MIKFDIQLDYLKLLLLKKIKPVILITCPKKIITGHENHQICSLDLQTSWYRIKSIPKLISTCMFINSNEFISAFWRATSIVMKRNGSADRLSPKMTWHEWILTVTLMHFCISVSTKCPWVPLYIIHLYLIMMTAAIRVSLQDTKNDCFFIWVVGKWGAILLLLVGKSTVQLFWQLPEDHNQLRIIWIFVQATAKNYSSFSLHPIFQSDHCKIC